MKTTLFHVKLIVKTDRSAHTAPLKADFATWGCTFVRNQIESLYIIRLCTFPTYRKGNAVHSYYSVLYIYVHRKNKLKLLCIDFYLITSPSRVKTLPKYLQYYQLLVVYAAPGERLWTNSSTARTNVPLWLLMTSAHWTASHYHFVWPPETQ